MSQPSKTPGFFETVVVPNELASKVSPGGPPADQAIRRAEKAIASRAGEYKARCQQEILALLEALPTERSVDRGALHPIHAIAHELRGEAGIYGYALIGMIASLLCQYLSAFEETAKVDVRVVEAHVDALRVASAGNNGGHGGDTGQQLVISLTKLHDNMLHR